MNNGNNPVNGDFKQVGDVSIREGGLTKREHFAAIAMQGIVGNEFLIRDKCDHSIARRALSIADALLEELEK